MMPLRKLQLYWNTLRYLKWIQIRYQFVSRIRQAVFSITYYTKFTGRKIYPVKHVYPACTIANHLYLGNNRFCFLNLEKDFGQEVNWAFNDYGKLWNYNLQYFDYLNEETIPDTDKIRLLDSFSKALLSKKIKPEAFPVSLRLINWILFYTKTEYKGEAFIQALLLQIGYLEANPEFHLLANHLLENYIALAICGVCLKDEVLAKKYLHRTAEEFEIQVLADGGHYEGSPMYHCLLLAKLFLLIDVMETNRQDTILTERLKEKAGLMLGWLDSACNATGDYICFNDAAPGIAVEPKELFARAKSMGIHWEPMLLKESGYRKLMNEDFRVMIDVADIIPSYQPGHAHSDLFHFTMEHKGIPVFVEVGTSTYQNNARRKYERSTMAHNTVVVNDTDQSEVWSSFRVAKRARVTALAELADHINASHDGYADQYGIKHNRSFSLPEPGGFLVKDEIVTQTENSYQAVALFHLDPSISVVSISNNQVSLSNGLQIVFEHAEAVETAAYQKANGFNRLVDAEKIIVHFVTSLHTKITIS